MAFHASTNPLSLPDIAALANTCSPSTLRSPTPADHLFPAIFTSPGIAASDRFPADWNSFFVGEAFEMQLGKMLSKAFKIGKTPKPYLANKNVQWDRVDLRSLETMDFTDAERGKFSLLPGDLLVCEGGEIGRTAMWHGEMPDCYFQKAIHRLRPRTDVLPEYMLRYMRLASTNGWLVDFMSQSSIAHLTREQFARVPICVPSCSHQRKIARILTTVDNLIEKTEALIAKYQAIKQGMMHDLFTRGVDEHGNLRPPYEQAPELYKQSELGWIPKEWEAVPLRDCTGPLITYGIVQAGPHIEGGIPYIRTGDMSGNRLNREDMLCTSPAIARGFERSEVHAGEIVCAIRATVGKVLEVPPELDGANLTQGTARISPKSTVDSRFLLWAIRSEAVQRRIHLAVKGTTFAEITLAQLREVVVPLPKSRREQAWIADSLNGCESRVQAERDLLDNLRQQKTGLMQDLLTGKVRVKVDEVEEVAAHA